MEFKITERDIYFAALQMGIHKMMTLSEAVEYAKEQLVKWKQLQPPTPESEARE